MNTKADIPPWDTGLWNEIRQAVLAEFQRINIGMRFLPQRKAGEDARTVPADLIESKSGKLFIEEAPTTPLIETWAEFALSPQQLSGEPKYQTAKTLAVRAANFLAQAKDALIFQGEKALSTNPTFTEKRVFARSGPAGVGLLDAAQPAGQLEVAALDSASSSFGDNTFSAIAEGYSRLQGLGHHGPYAVVLHSLPYADAFAPIPSLLRPAERIETLLQGGLYGTATLPPGTGFLVSTGGSSLEVLVGREPAAAFLQEDPDGSYRFRVWQRFALRIRDPSAIIGLRFRTGAG